MTRCLSLAKKYNLKIVEDCAEAFGSNIKYVENWFHGSDYFNGNKIITTGGGGIIITNSKKFITK